MARPVKYFGVPFGNLTRANRLTIPGSLVDVARFRHARDMGQGAAILSVGTGIHRKYMDASQNPYHKALATDVYNVQLNGLGDGLPQSATPNADITAPNWQPSDFGYAPGSGASTTPSSSSSGWMSVLNTFVGNVSKGIAAKIGGYNPNVPVTMPKVASAFPSWAPLALAGLGGFFLLKQLRKRA